MFRYGCMFIKRVFLGVHGSLQDGILQFWYKANPMLVILGCSQSLLIFGTFIQMFIFGTFIQMKMIFPLCLVFSPRYLRLFANINLGSSLHVIHTLHMKQEHNISMVNMFVFECLYVFMCAGSTAPLRLL